MTPKAAAAASLRSPGTLIIAVAMGAVAAGNWLNLLAVLAGALATVSIVATLMI